MSRIPVNAEIPKVEKLPKPPWLKVRLPVDNTMSALKKQLRKADLVSICEEASCPNIFECFSHKTASFMILGDICTRRCTFCDVAHGRPGAVDSGEPERLANTISQLGLRYVVVTSVNRDDLLDAGASHFVACLKAIKKHNPNTKVEFLVPDFKRKEERAFAAFSDGMPDVLNHNLETVPRIYNNVRPGSSYEGSLKLLQDFKLRYPSVPTKTGIMLGLGESIDEVKSLMHDCRAHDIDMMTIGQYLQPTPVHHPVIRYVHPDEFAELEVYGKELGFSHVASGALVRSSYHADKQAQGLVDD